MALDYRFYDDGATIRLEVFDGVTHIRTTKFNKNNVSITILPESGLFEISDLKGSACADESNVSVPAHTDLVDLCEQIEAFMDSTTIGGATAANQAQMITHLNNIETNTQDIENLIDGLVRTPTLINTSTSGTIAAGANRVGFFNDGVADGTVNGVVLPKGVSISFEGQLNDTLAAIPYDATGTTFIIAET